MAADEAQIFDKRVVNNLAAPFADAALVAAGTVWTIAVAAASAFRAHLHGLSSRLGHWKATRCGVQVLQDGGAHIVRSISSLRNIADAGNANQNSSIGGVTEVSFRRRIHRVSR